MNMRLWSIHPKYLDNKGLGGVWSEALLAKKALYREIKAYRNHSALERFKKCKLSFTAINTYLWFIKQEADKRGLNYRASNIEMKFVNPDFRLPVSTGQLQHEAKLLNSKLQKREDCGRIQLDLTRFDEHPMFDIYYGNVESWEKTNLP